eukprot:1157479-Pelagomonas_calceolata.AAC.7
MGYENGSTWQAGANNNCFAWTQAGSKPKACCFGGEALARHGEGYLYLPTSLAVAKKEPVTRAV